MGYLSQSTLDLIASDPSKSEYYYGVCKSNFISTLGAGYSSVPDNLLRLMWCGMVANHLKPYGPCSVHDLDGLLASDVLDCDNYAALAIRLYEIMTCNNDASYALLGFKGGAVGNHAQLIAWDGTYSVVIDPTVCVFALSDYDDLISGVPASGVVDINWQWSALDTFEMTVKGALSGGLYKPSDCMYWFRTIEQLTGIHYSVWVTPQGGVNS